MYKIVHDIVYIFGGLFLILFSQLKLKKNNNTFSKRYSVVLSVTGIFFILGFGTSFIYSLVSIVNSSTLEWIEKSEDVYYAVINDNDVIVISVYGHQSFDNTFIENIEQNLQKDGYDVKKDKISFSEKKHLESYISSFQKYLSINNAKLFIINSRMINNNLQQISYFCSITNKSRKKVLINDTIIRGSKNHKIPSSHQ